MPYLFTCPHCHTKTEVEDQFSGRSGQCVTCGGAIDIPQFVADTEKIIPAKRQDSTIRWIIASVVAVILLGCLVFSAVRLGGDTMNRLTTNRERNATIQNLEKIAKALNAYAADHGSYPPAVTRNGKQKLHSWRVLILPYLGEEELYDQFDLTLPWDDANNMAAARDMPVVYRHPKSQSAGMYLESGYYLVVGNGTLFPPQGPLGPDSIVDDPSQTILVVEATPLVPSSLWIEPIDMDFGRMTGNIGTSNGVEVGGLLDGGVGIVTADERGHFLPDTMPPSRFRSLITPAGGERLPDDTLD